MTDFGKFLWTCVCGIYVIMIVQMNIYTVKNALHYIVVALREYISIGLFVRYKRLYYVRIYGWLNGKGNCIWTSINTVTVTSGMSGCTLTPCLM